MAIPSASDVVRNSSSTGAFASGGGGYAGERVITGTTDTPTVTDKDKRLRTTGATATQITLTGTGFTQGDSYDVIQDGAGQVEFLAGSSNTLLPNATLKLRDVGSVATVAYLGSNRWLVVGDLQSSSSGFTHPQILARAFIGF